MRIQSTTKSPIEFENTALVIGVHENQPLSESAKTVDNASEGRLSQLIESGEIATDECTTTHLLSLNGLNGCSVVVVGLGTKEDRNPGLSYRSAGAAAKLLAAKPRSDVAFFMEPEFVEQGVCGSIVGCIGQDLFRSEKELHPFENIFWYGASEEQIANGRVLGESMNLTRKTVNLPANEIYPESFADECKSVAKEAGLEAEIWDESKLASENCGAFLAVARGSSKPPRLAILRHNGGKAGEAPIALVGKGVTFDSGGLSLKPSAGMLDMKCDMTGAATVLGTMSAIARLNLPINVVGLMGLAENMVSGNSYKLGDVLTARNGKTIEVHNTDAEGRLVLADTLDVAVGMGVARIIDLATLTGACMVALGRDTSGVMTNNQDFCNDLLDACRSVGESAWQLPMFPFYSKHIKSKVADIKNVGDARWGGAITAGKFLEEFVADVPWVHIDIAGPSFQEKPKPWIDAGASGCMVVALVEYLTRQLENDA